MICFQYKEKQTQIVRGIKHNYFTNSSTQKSGFSEKKCNYCKIDKYFILLKIQKTCFALDNHLLQLKCT